ncbi:tyrosine-type recombinase/integrase [bacterium]|nr:tyrosine-type recombinase/integrase [bacterium]
MAKDRITVWAQSFKDRPYPMLQWIDPDSGKRKSISTGTADAKEIEQKRADKEYELNNGLHVEKSKMTWARFRELFEAEYLPGLRERSREKYGTVLDVLEDEGLPKTIGEISERTISKLVTNLRCRKVMIRNRFTAGAKPTRESKVKKVGLEPVTIRNYLVALRTVLTWGADQRIFPSVPKFPKIKVPKKKPQAVPTESFERLLDVAPNEVWKGYLQCCWWSGLRLSEAWKLRWSPSSKFPFVDLQAGRIVLPAEFAKSGQDQWVPIHPKLREIFEELPRTGSDVFPLRGVAGRPMTRAGISSFVCHLAKRAGVRLSMHKLRKGFGCRVASTLGKGNAPVLHQLMRHSSMQITMDYYANVDDVLSQAIEQIG